MATVLFSSDALSINIRYLWQKGSGTKKSPFYYRRRVPKDVAEILCQQNIPTSIYHCVALKTRDLQLAAKWVTQINRKQEEYWHRLRQGKAVEAVCSASGELLAGIGIADVAMSEKRKECPSRDYLVDLLVKEPEGVTDIERRALHIVEGKGDRLLSEALGHYLSTRDAPRKRVNEANRSFAMVIDLLGDRPIQHYKRLEVAAVIKEYLVRGFKTLTIKRQMGIVRTAVKELIRDHELSAVSNAFDNFVIPAVGADSQKRSSLSHDQVNRVREGVRQASHKDRSEADIVGILVDTGARLAEITGLLKEDVILDAEIPYIYIRPNAKRSLKTKNSVRTIPLVGDALFAIQRAMEVDPDSEYLFSRYMRASEISGSLASRYIGRFLKKCGVTGGTSHCLRHTMTTRLRSAGIPLPRIEEILGWSSSSMAMYYGEGTAMFLLRNDLLKTLDCPNRVD